MNTRVIQDEPNPVNAASLETLTSPPSKSVPPGVVDAPAGPRGPGKVMALAFGTLAVLLAILLLSVGGAALFGLGERDAAGYFTTGTHELSTDTRALVTENFEVDTGVPGWGLGRDLATARIEATSAQPIFLGIGPSADVERYLASVRHAQITDIDTDPFTVSSDIVDGTARPAPPATQEFWRVQATGSGTQTVSWPLEEGDWSAVAMNADGSSSVALDARFAARIPSLRAIALGLLIGGAILLMIGAGLLYVGVKQAPRPRAT